MKSACRQFGFFVAASIGWITVGQAAPLAVYQYNSASLNPNTQGWTWNGTGTLSDNAADAALNVIQSGGTRFTNTLGAASVTDPSGWTLTATVRVNSVSPTLTVGARYGIVLAVDTGAKWWNVSFFKDGTTNDGVWSGFTPTQLVSISDMNVFHTFQLIDNDGLDSTAPMLYVDGLNSGMSAIDGGHFRPAGDVWWGNGNSGSAANSDWQYVAFEIGQHPVPEPSAIALACASIIAISGVIRRKRG